MIPTESLIENLKEKADAQGHITLDDLLDALPSQVESQAQWEAILAALGECGFSVAEEKRVSADNNRVSGRGSEPRAAPLDNVAFYLQRAGMRALLTAEEEKQLARCLEQGQRAAEQLREGTAEERMEDLRREIADGEAAREQLIRSNLRLVVSIAKRYRGMGLPFLDLIQEGNLGLMQAVDRFHWRQGTRFSTYATWWIRHAIHRALDNHARTIRLPTNVTETMRLIRQTGERLRHHLGRKPSAAELAEQAGVTPDTVQQLQRLTQRVVSLDAPIGNDLGPEKTLGDVIEDHHTPRPMEQVTKQSLREDVRSLLRKLSGREQTVLRLRYGLDDGAVHTLNQVADELGVTRERARQIEMRALRKLRFPHRACRLRPYVRG